MINPVLCCQCYLLLICELLSLHNTNFILQPVQPELKKKCHEILAEYFRDTKTSLRRTEELAFQYERCGNMQKLLEEMTDPR